MKSLKSVAAAEREINNILTERNSFLSQMDKDGAAIAAALDGANTALAAAIDSDDLSEYSAAKARISALSDEKEFHEARCRKFNEQPLISAEKYNSLVSAIKHEYSEFLASARAELAAHSEAMSAIADNAAEIAGEANSVLKKLQEDIYQNADRTGHKNARGETFFMPGSSQNVSPAPVYEWGKSGVRRGEYGVYTGNH